jgi:hypothetical protein
MILSARARRIPSSIRVRATSVGLLPYPPVSTKSDKYTCRFLATMSARPSCLALAVVLGVSKFRASKYHLSRCSKGLERRVELWHQRPRRKRIDAVAFEAVQKERAAEAARSPRGANPDDGPGCDGAISASGFVPSPTCRDETSGIPSRRPIGPRSGYPRFGEGSK